ncbi:MAG TPA: hypothetical protein VGU66_14790 [Candidatus Elarobacter sp.]|nr:hypothetical protein [Candidatus Elarobacter sp.]
MPVKSAGTPESVKVTVIIGGTTAGRGSSSGVRRPKFISPSTNGIDFKVYAHGGNTIIGQSDTDISSGSAACGGQTGTPRTCTIQVPAPAGNDDFVATTYDGAPVSGSFASSHALGTGRLTATIVSGQANNLTMYISGIINTLGFLAAHASLPADGAPHTLGFVLNPSDFDNNPITAGANDPYANPITVQLTETGGSGHAQIVKNGTPTGGTSTTLNFSTDTVAVKYDGGGAPGYDVAVAVSSTNVTPETLTISPMFVTSPSPYYSGTALTFTSSGQTAQVNLSETGAANSTQYSATPSGSCAGVATSSPPAAGPSSSTTVTAGSTAGSCTIAFSDGMSTITWTVSVATTGASVTVPSNTVGPITFASYSNSPVRGQQGWLSNSCGNSDYNANVVNTSSYPSAQWPGTPPTKALQIDNSVTQGCFSGLGSPPVPNAAGYPNALSDTSTNPPAQCGPTCNPFFSVQFVVTSATGAWQPALEMSISPVWNNQGARMQYIGLWHTTDSGSNQKLLIFTNDVEGVFPANTPTPCFQCANFVPWEIKYVDPALPHTIGMTMQFVQPNADVVKFYVDGVLSGVSQTSFRSWEDYYLFDTESDPNGTYPYSRAVNDLLFHPGNVDTCLNFADYAGNCDQRSSGPGHTSTAGNGFLFNNLTTCAGTAASCAGAIQTSSMGRSVQDLTRSTRRVSSTFHRMSQLR